MGRLFKLFMKVVLSLFLLLAGLTLCTIFYVKKHKKELLQELVKGFNKHINGKVSIEDLEPELVLGFPNISFKLSKVSITDSLLISKRQDMLSAGKIEITVDFFSILHGNPDISKIKIRDGNIYVYSDSSGKSNIDKFWKTKKESPGGGEPAFDQISLDNMHFIFENIYRLKYFEFDIEQIKAKIKYDDSTWYAKTDLNLFVKEFVFNSYNGSLLKNKKVSAQFDINFNPESSKIDISSKKVKVDNDVLSIIATVSMAQKPTEFTLNISAEHILFRNASELMSQSISSKLNIINFDKPVTINALVKGKMQFRDTPIVNVHYKIKDNTLHVPGFTIEHCSFEGKFINNMDATIGHNNQNSMIEINHFTGSWSNLPFTIDSLQIKNLANPNLHAEIKSRFPLKKLNNILDKDKVVMKDGMLDVKLKYHGNLKFEDLSNMHLSGNAEVENADMLLVAQQINLKHTNAQIEVNNNDLLIRKIHLQNGNNELNISGVVNNYLSIVQNGETTPGIDWQIKSKKIDLNELMILAERFKDYKPKSTRVLTSSFNQSINEFRAKASMKFRLDIDTLEFKQFVTYGVLGNIIVLKDGIDIENASIGVAGGKINFNGNIVQRDKLSKVNSTINMKDLKIKDVFTTFNNFGQTKITYNNLSGKITADADINLLLDDEDHIIQESIVGKVNYELKDAVLNDFEPIQKIGKTIFRNRDFKNLQIRNFKHSFQIAGDKLTLSPLHIETNALTIDLSGVFGIKGGTDLNFSVPLRNPKKDEAELNDSVRILRSNKGIVMKFKATDDVNGKIKVDWVTKEKFKGELSRNVESVKKEWKETKNLFRRRKNR